MDSLAPPKERGRTWSLERNSSHFGWNVYWRLGNGMSWHTETSVAFIGMFHLRHPIVSCAITYQCAIPITATV
jgi:hypothetical protein